nr:unnamed protein product [Callosobruchus chinensis]
MQCRERQFDSSATRR